MPNRRSHLSDIEILLLIDGELPARRLTHARNHLAECESCSSRRAELEGASTDFSRVHDETVGSWDPRLLRSRSLLKAQIAERASRSPRGWASQLLHVGSLSRQLACASVALVIVGAGWWVVREYKLKHLDPESSEYQLALPRQTLTPGAVLQVSADELCGTRAVDNDPPVNPALQQAVFSEYGLPNSSPIGYTLDYLITPALGGSDDIKNLWPQPYSSVWNARVKDQLENHLHQLVCQGKVPLGTAQTEIATDWISAYKRYFNTDEPRPNPATPAAASAKAAKNLGSA